MPLITSLATARETPDSGQGGAAVSSDTNTGHGSTTCTANRSSNGTTTTTKTARWFTFDSVSGTITAINLIFDWTATGSVAANTLGVGDSASTQVDFVVEYTIDGGANWLPLVGESVGASGVDGTDGSDTLSAGTTTNQSIAAATAINQIQIRDFIEATGTVNEVGAASTTTSISATVSNIRLEVQVADTQLIVMW